VKHTSEIDVMSDAETFWFLPGNGCSPVEKYETFKFINELGFHSMLTQENRCLNQYLVLIVYSDTMLISLSSWAEISI
jgi:hypothetical protein